LAACFVQDGVDLGLDVRAPFVVDAKLRRGVLASIALGVFRRLHLAVEVCQVRAEWCKSFAMRLDQTIMRCRL
jgi:hypothetical protein